MTTTMMTMTGDVPREDQRGVEPSSTPAFEVGSGWMALHATGGSVLPLCIQ